MLKYKIRNCAKNGETKPMKKKYTFKTLLVDLIFDFVGCGIYGIALNSFIVPAGFATGGISGVALVLNYITGLQIGLLNLLINIPLTIFAFRILGKTFMLKSIKSLIILTISIDYITPVFPDYVGDPILAAICAGILVGAGLSLTFIRGSSTGGGDFVSLPIQKLYPHFSIGFLTMAFDYCVLALGGIVFGNINATLYGAVAMYVAGKIIDSIMYGSAKGKLLFIVTNEGEKVAKGIFEACERGSTVADIRGGYRGEPRQLVISAVSKNQLYKARRAAHDADELSFTMITSTEEVFGEGFSDPRDA